MRKAINHLKECDPVLRAIIERVGPFRMEYGEPQFCSVAEAIVYQQLNGKAAQTILKRFASLAGEPLTPEGILRLSDEQLRRVGLSKQKSAYLKDLAAKTAAGVLDFSKLPALPHCSGTTSAFFAFAGAAAAGPTTISAAPRDTAIAVTRPMIRMEDPPL